MRNTTRTVLLAIPTTALVVGGGVGIGFAATSGHHPTPNPATTNVLMPRHEHGDKPMHQTRVRHEDRRDRSQRHTEQRHDQCRDRHRSDHATPTTITRHTTNRTVIVHHHHRAGSESAEHGSSHDD